MLASSADAEAEHHQRERHEGDRGDRPQRLDRRAGDALGGRQEAEQGADCNPDDGGNRQPKQRRFEGLQRGEQQGAVAKAAKPGRNNIRRARERFERQQPGAA